MSVSLSWASLLRLSTNFLDKSLTFIAEAESTGALVAVSEYCYEHVKFASSALKKLPDNNASKLLSEIVNYLTLDRKA